MARKFYHKAVLEPLARGEDRLAGLHANTQVPKLIGLARLYEVAGEPRDAATARFFWDRVVHHYSYVNGGNSYNESFGPPDKQAGTLHDTTETCNTYNMLKLTRHLFMWEPRAELMDFYERALLNHILAHQHPESGMFVYKGFLDPLAQKGFSTPFDSFWCCVGTGMENHVKYGESIYFHNADALFVNLFIHSRLTWAEQGLTLTQKTDWPFSGAVKLHLKLEQPRALLLNLRIPAWAIGAIVLRVNGEPFTLDTQPGAYVSLKRQWQDGDEITLELPMALRYETMPDDDSKLAVFYGPTLLAALLDAEADAVPALVADREKLLERIKPVRGKPLHFKTHGLGRPRDVELIPLFQVADQRYNVYFDYLAETQWAELEAARAAQRRRLAELEARTTDAFLPGQMQPEREHNLAGENIQNGRHAGRTWRDARSGGWFSFEMNVDPARPMTLVCTYWGDDAGGRTFDILVEGEQIATQTLDRPKPGEFVDIEYKVPPELTDGKQRVTVRLQAHPGQIAGGLFGCRMLWNGD